MERLAPSFDAETQRFLVQRWHCEKGKRVLTRLKQALSLQQGVDEILNEFILKHPSNSDPYGYPVYPKACMGDDEFWVLATNDLRGIRLHDLQLVDCRGLEHKSLSYGSLASCVCERSSMGNCEMSFMHVEHCTFTGVDFSLATAHQAHFESCDFRGASFWECHFSRSRFHDCDLRGVYLEDALIEKISVDYQTQVDLKLCESWNGRNLPTEQQADLLRELRIAYERAELWHRSDQLLFYERVANRKHIIWPLCKKEPNILNIASYLEDLSGSWLCGYGTKPIRVFWVALYVTVAYALFFVCAGLPITAGISEDLDATRNLFDQLLVGLYYSMSNFSTLGYGDMYYMEDQPYLRLVSTTEAWIGAMLIAFFVVVIGRKFLR